MTAVTGSFMHSTTHLLYYQLRCALVCEHTFCGEIYNICMYTLCIYIFLFLCILSHLHYVQVKKFMGGYEMFAQSQRDLTAEQVHVQAHILQLCVLITACMVQAYASAHLVLVHILNDFQRCRSCNAVPFP